MTYFIISFHVFTSPASFIRVFVPGGLQVTLLGLCKQDLAYKIRFSRLTSTYTTDYKHTLLDPGKVV